MNAIRRGFGSEEVRDIVKFDVVVKWTEEENEKFREALLMHGGDLKKVWEDVGTRTMI